MVQPRFSHFYLEKWHITIATRIPRHLNKKNWTALHFLFGANKIKIDQISKNIALSIFGNEAPKAALYNYRIQCLRP